MKIIMQAHTQERYKKEKKRLKWICLASEYWGKTALMLSISKLFQIFDQND